MILRLKQVKRTTVHRGGRTYTYYYHRGTGERLPDDEDERARRVLEINRDLSQPQVRRGDFADLIRSYRASPEYRNKAPVTKRGYNRHLNAIAAAWGALRVEGLRRRNVRQMRDTLAETPRAANLRMQVLKLLINWGLEADERYGTANPASRIKMLKEGPGYLPWPDNVILEFEQVYPELRWIVLAALYTGQRGQDLVKMLWSHIEDGGINVVQQKEDVRLWIPMHSNFARVVSEIPRRAAVMFTTKTGRPWKLENLRHEIERYGRKGYTLHGLRHNAAERLAEAGCTEAEIKSITGHKSAAMVQRYTRRASQKRLARAAITRLEREKGDG